MIALGILWLAIAAPRNAKTSPPAPPPSARTYAARVLGEEEPRYGGEPISLDLKDADLVDVLLSFSKVARTNIVIDPGVHGSVTVRLIDVPWDQAFDLILRLNGYGSVRDGNILRVGVPSRLR
jgi:type IV pilus assembly protein PilQ